MQSFCKRMSTIDDECGIGEVAPTVQIRGLREEKREFVTKCVFGRYVQDVVGNDVCFCVDAAETIAYAVVEEEGSLEPR